jgi:hypothetical protein
MEQNNQETSQIQPASSDHLTTMERMDSFVTNSEMARQDKLVEENYALQIVNSMSFDEKLKFLDDLKVIRHYWDLRIDKLVSTLELYLNCQAWF